MISVGVKIRYIILMILVFFALIAIIVFLYQILYKKQINNTLHGKKPFSFMEPINFLLSVILIIILVLVIRLNVKTNEVS